MNRLFTCQTFTHVIASDVTPNLLPEFDPGDEAIMHYLPLAITTSRRPKIWVWLPSSETVQNASKLRRGSREPSELV